MSALYAMRFVGQAGPGFGAVYVGNGKIVGVNAANGRYHGTYVIEGGRLKGTITLSIPGGGTLVTGMPLGPGQTVQFSADWPENFANGQPQQVNIAGLAVSVTLEKIGDI